MPLCGTCIILNDTKIKVIRFSTKFCGQGPVPQCDLHVGGVSISSNAVRNF